MNPFDWIVLISIVSIFLMVPGAIESTMNMMPAIKRYIEKFKRKPKSK